jgi:hypothetical protein
MAANVTAGVRVGNVLGKEEGVQPALQSLVTKVGEPVQGG